MLAAVRSAAVLGIDAYDVDVIRTREYDAQPRPHAFGSLTALLFQ